MAGPRLTLGVTGTDTGVGKTTVCRALLALLAEAGVRAAGMKPVESGVRRGDAGSDAERLRAAGDPSFRLDDLCPYTLPDPLAPLLAAERAGVRLDESRLDACFRELAARSDAVLVEGAGGVLVPLAPGLTILDLFARWRLPALVVAANRLGVLNHTLLTVAALRGAGVPATGVVLTPVRLSPEESLATATNAAMLRRLLPDVPLFEFPSVAAEAAAGTLADAARTAGLAALAAPFAALPTPS